MVKKITTIDDNMCVRTRWDLRRVFVLSLLLNLGLGIYIFFLEIDVIHHYQQVVVEKPVDDIPLTDSAITAELTYLGCVLPNVALAQMKIESSHFQSKICKENKNIAGINEFLVVTSKHNQTFDKCLLCVDLLGSNANC